MSRYRRSIPSLLWLGLVLVGCETSESETNTGGSGGTGSGGVASATAAGGTSMTNGVGGSTAASGGASGIGCFDYASFSPTAVSFGQDVMPLFQSKCAQCHNDTSASTYYGPNAAVVYDKLLNGTPKQAPHLKFVAPNDPVRSYMLAKVEYANPGGTCSLVQCSEPGCELSAPPGNPLSEAERGILRSWVMSGAVND